MQQRDRKLIRLARQQMFVEYPDLLIIPWRQRTMQNGEYTAYDFVRSGPIASIRIGPG